MFFCEECRIENGWRGSIRKSLGYCEICERHRFCHNVPTWHLILPEKLVNGTIKIQPTVADLLEAFEGLDPALQVFIQDCEGRTLWNEIRVREVPHNGGKAVVMEEQGWK